MTLFDGIKSFVGFGPEDVQALAAFHDTAVPHIPDISEAFYRRIMEHPDAHAAITGGQAQVDRLKQTLVQWMRSGLAGPHDEAFYEKRARIGRVHVVIGLPQQYMFTAMNVIRLRFRELTETLELPPGVDRQVLSNAIDKLFDMELAIMLQTYREDSDARLRQRERLATIGQLAATIGHDLRNPLGVVQSSLYILRKRMGEDARTTKHLDKIGNQVEVCNEIITDLLELARDRTPHRKDVPVDSLLDEVMERSQVPGDIHVNRRVEGVEVLHIEAGLVRQALVNIVSNAVTALEEAGGTITISVTAAAPEGGVVVTVTDDGPGFPPEVLPKVFDPLVTTRVKGTGLGLALARSVVERHGGQAVAVNTEQGGAQVELHLPAPPSGGVVE